MLTDNLIIALSRFVTDFSKVEEGSLSFAPEVYQRQLDEYYDGMTKTIISDINRDIDWLRNKVQNSFNVLSVPEPICNAIHFNESIY